MGDQYMLGAEGKTMPHLTCAEVKKRLASYSQPAVTDELYSSGQSLVSDAIDRIARLDAKASVLAAYSGGILTILISTSGIWGKLLSGWFVPIATCGILAFMLAAWLAIRSIYPQRTEWYTDNGWLQSDCIQDSERLRRYRVLTMWKILTSYFAAIKIKNRRLKASVWTMHVAFLLLLICLLKVAGAYTFFQHLRVWIR